MDALCRGLVNAATGKTKGAAAASATPADASGPALLRQALDLAAAVRGAPAHEVRGVARCKQLGNAGHVLLTKAEQVAASPAGRGTDHAAVLTAAVLSAASAAVVAVAIQEAVDAAGSSSSGGGGSGGASSASPGFNHNDVKECASLTARLTGDCLGPVARLAVERPAPATAPALALLGALEHGFHHLGPAFRRIGVDAINFAVIVGTAVPAARPVAARVIAAAVTALARVRRSGPAAASDGKPGGKPGGAWAYEPAPYVRAALAGIEGHLAVARQAAAHAPTRLPAAQAVTTLFRSAGDAAGHQLTQLAGAGGGAGAGVAAVDDGSAGVPDAALAGAVASRLLLLVAAVRHMIAPSVAPSSSPAAVAPETVTLPLPAVLQLASAVTDVQSLAQQLGGPTATTVLVVAGDGGSASPLDSTQRPRPAAEAVAAEGLALLTATLTAAGPRLRRYRSHVLRTAAGVMAQHQQQQAQAAARGGQQQQLLPLGLAAAAFVGAYARQLGLGSGSPAGSNAFGGSGTGSGGSQDVNTAVFRAASTCLSTLQAASAGGAVAGAHVAVAVTVLHDLLAAHWHGLPDGLRLVIERCAIALATGSAAPLGAAPTLAGGAALALAGSAASGSSSNSADVLMLGGGLEGDEDGNNEAASSSSAAGGASKKQRTGAGAGSSSSSSTAPPGWASQQERPSQQGRLVYAASAQAALHRLPLALGARAGAQLSQQVAGALHGLLAQAVSTPWQGGGLSPLTAQLAAAAAACGPHAAHYAIAPLGLGGLLARAMTQAELAAVRPPAGPGFPLAGTGGTVAAVAAAAAGPAAFPRQYQQQPHPAAAAAAPLAQPADGPAAAASSAAAGAGAGSSFSFTAAAKPAYAAASTAPAAPKPTTAAPTASGGGADGDDDDFPDIVDEAPDAY